MKSRSSIAHGSAIESLESRRLLSAAFGTNLILNPGAENYDGTADGYNIITPKNWTANGDATVASYKHGYGPLIGIRIPSNAGNTFFAGGPNDESDDFFQTIDLSSIATQLDAGQVSFTLAAEIGGNTTDSDNATVFVNFKDASQTLVQQVSVGDVSPSDRDYESKFIEKTTTGNIKPDVRFAQVQIHMKRDDGAYNDGFADNLSLVLTTNTPSTVGITPSVVKSTVPAIVISGQKIKGAITLNLTNTSTSKNNGVVTTALYASSDGVIDSSSTKLTSLPHNFKFQAGKSARFSVPLKSLSLPAGSYEILAQTTDSLGTVVDATSGPAISVADPVIALSATASATTPATVVAGKFMSFTVQLSNTGNINSTGPATIAISLSTLPSFGGAILYDPLITQKKSFTLKPGAKPLLLRLRVKIPTGTAPDLYQPNLLITQGSESVEAAAGTVTVTS